MAEEKKNGNGKMVGGMTCSCGCGCGGFGSHGRHWTFFLLRVLITIIILMMVFWFGVAAGRLSGIGWGRYMMDNGYSSTGTLYNGTGVAAPMMRINGATSTSGATGSVQNY